MNKENASDHTSKLAPKVILSRSCLGIICIKVRKTESYDGCRRKTSVFVFD